MNGRQGSAPLYARVAGALRDGIIAGEHPVGSLLPAEDELAQRFSVSRHTVREALRRLREEGLVVSRQGAGTTVAAPDAPDAYVLHAMSIADLVDFAKGSRLLIQHMGIERIGGAKAVHIGVPAGSAWLSVRGVRVSDGADTPLCVTDYYINERFASIARLLPRHSGPIFPVLEDMFAVRIAEVEQEIGAAAAGEATAGALGVGPEAIVLAARRVYRLDDGTIAQISINQHPAARFRHSMTMRRVERR